jgi:Rieske Fe-S protein
MNPLPSQQEPLWREEFAIDAPSDAFVQRRQFTKFLVLTSFGMFLGNVWIWVKSRFQQTPAYSAQPIARIDELAVGAVKVFQYPTAGDHCLLIRLTEERFVAYSQKCTHLSCAVYYSADQRRLECPCHEGYFSVEDGAVLQGPPPRPLPQVQLERRGSDLIALGFTAHREG